MSELQDYEILKSERRRLSGQKKRAVNAYTKAVQTQDYSYVETLKDRFIENFELEKHLYDYIGIDSNYYPIFFDNVFQALGFGVYIGPMPTVSGTQPNEPFHIAFDASRIILIRGFPATLFSEIADVQSLSTKPILGVSYTTWVKDTKTATDWEQKYSKISSALGIGRLQINSYETLKVGIKLNPKQDSEKLRQFAKEIGLMDFLSLPVDNLPLYGSFSMGERKQTFDEKNIKKMLVGSIQHGHQLANGTITGIDPLEALEDPGILVRELGKCDFIEETDKINITPIGEKYVKETLIGTAQEAALLKTAELSILDNLKWEFHNLEQRLDYTILSSKKEIITAINEVRLEVKESGTKRNISAKYVIEAPPGSPIKLQVEIPIGEISDEDILLKIAEIKMKIGPLPQIIIDQFKNSLKNLPKIPQNVKESILKALH